MWELATLTEYIQQLSAIGIYLFLGLSAIIENIFPPYPGDTVTVFCGFLAAHDVITLPWAFVSVLIGNMIGAWIMYYAGERILHFARRMHDSFQRPKIIKKALSKLTSTRNMQKTTEWFNKRGVWLVLLSRFSAGVRFFVSIVAGISKMNIFWFSMAFAAGVLIWNTLLLLGGFALGDNWEWILTGLKIYNQAIFSILIIGIVIYIYWKYKRRSKQTKILNDGK